MIDFKHTESGDIDLSSGDFQLSESTEQHQKDILVSGKGDYDEHPTIGVGVVAYMNDNDTEGFLRAVRKQLSSDGMNVRAVGFSEGELTIDASYDNNR